MVPLSFWYKSIIEENRYLEIKGGNKTISKNLK